MTRPSRFKIKGVGAIVLQVTEPWMCRIFGNYLLVPNATANLISISEMSNFGIMVLFVDNKSILTTICREYNIKRSSDFYSIFQKRHY